MVCSEKVGSVLFQIHVNLSYCSVVVQNDVHKTIRFLLSGSDSLIFKSR